MVRKEMLQARAILRDALLEKVNNQEKQNKITFNLTYHPVFRDLRKILEEFRVILASDDGYKKVFFDFYMTGKAHLVRLQLPDLDEVGRSNCNSKMAVSLIECEICGEQYTGSTKKNLDLEQITLRVRKEVL